MLCPVLRAGSVGHAWVITALECKSVLCTTYNGLREEQEQHSDKMSAQIGRHLIQAIYHSVVWRAAGNHRIPDYLSNGCGETSLKSGRGEENFLGYLAVSCIDLQYQGLVMEISAG